MNPGEPLGEPYWVLIDGPMAMVKIRGYIGRGMNFERLMLSLK